MLLLVSHINFNSELLAFETVLFLICSISNLYDLSQRVFDSVRHTLRSSFISLPVTCLCCLPAIEVWSDENMQCLQKWLPTWHSAVHQLPTWILIAFRSVFLPVIFSLSISSMMRLSSPGASLLLVHSSSFILSSNQSGSIFHSYQSCQL